MIDASPISFLDEFRRKHGRAPTVLHIGNIANNAYINAKLLNDAGYDCDVICYDYYHIMGCPEWEDADFEGEVGDHFLPHWRNLDLRGFERPRWFVQGPQYLSLEYLTAKRAANWPAAQSLWAQLAEVNQTRNWQAASQVGFAHVFKRTIRLFRSKLSRIHSANDVFRGLWFKLDRWSGARPARRMAAALAALSFLLLAPLVILPALGLKGIRRVQRWWLGLAQLKDDHHAVAWAQMTAFADSHGLWGWLVTFAMAPIVTVAVAVMRQARADQAEDSFGGRAEELVQAFPREFPDRTDPLTLIDNLPFSAAVSAWRRLFASYDVIVAYSIDGILPLLAGVPYFAFEHGTLREIPFRRAPEGRRTALSYRLAEHVFVTNFDCLGNAEQLAPGRNTLINHPFDEDHGLAVTGFEELRRSLQSELACDFVFFFPTRQDWVKGTGYADKGNDVFFRAFATLQRAGFSTGVVCCEWGANVAHSKALLNELGCSSHVKWISPLPTVRFERMARAAHCVVDQFVLGSFGGVMFKAMAVGAPVLTYLDHDQLCKQYPETPPVVNCRTEEQIVDTLSLLLRKPEQLAEFGAASRAWMKQYHSKHDTVRKQTHVFEAFLASR